MSDYVPLSVRQSRWTTWLWRHLPASIMTYSRGRWLAKRLP